MYGLMDICFLLVLECGRIACWLNTDNVNDNSIFFCISFEG
jgi:hypothetical protein